MDRTQASHDGDSKESRKHVLKTEQDAKRALHVEMGQYVKRRLLDTKPEKLKPELLGRNNVPSGIVAAVERSYNWAPGSFNGRFRTFKNIEVWKDFLAISFDSLAESAVTSTSISSSVQATSPSDKHQSRIKGEMRSCQTPLAAILAPHVKQDDDLKASVMAKIKDTMLAATEYSHDMSALLQATIIKYVTKPGPDWYSSPPMPVNAADILPEYACRNKSVLQNGCVPGLPPPNPPLKDDLFHLDHIQHLAACHFGHLQKDPTSKYPVCSYLDVHRAPAPLNPLVTANLQSIYNTKLATNMKNLMSRSCVKKMVHSLLRLLLQCHLAPSLEQQYHVAYIKAANEKAARIEAARQSKSKQLKKNWNHVRNAVRKQKGELEKKSSQNKLSNHQRDGFHARIKYLEGVMADLKIERNKLTTRQDKLDQKASFSNFMEESDLAFVDPLPEELYGLGELSLYDDAGAAIPNSDVSVRRLESLQGVLARILWHEQDMVLTDPLLAHYAMNLDLSSNEACALKKIYHVLKPYVVPEQPNYCHLNLLFFGSALLRLCGYDQLAMPYAPNDTTGSLNALPMDAAILFEMFGSTLEIKRDHGINAAIDAFHDKEKVFGCLFDMTVIRDICKEDGIDFSYSLDINPANEVSLQGLVPSQVYEQRLKQAKSDLQLLSSQHTLDSLKIDIAEAQVERNRRAKTKRDTFNALMIHQSVMKATDYSNPSMTAESKEASNSTPAIRKGDPSKKYADVKMHRYLKHGVQQAKRDVGGVHDELTRLRSIQHTLQKAKENEAKKGKNRASHSLPAGPAASTKHPTRTEEESALGKDSVRKYKMMLEMTKLGPFPLVVDEEIQGYTMSTPEEWQAHPCRQEIMDTITSFKLHMRELSKRCPRVPGSYYLGRPGRLKPQINTPILQTNNDGEYGMDELIAELRECGANDNIIDELENTEFSKPVFCHNYLCYKSLVLDRKDGRLIGIKNWQYAGFYPPEFEDIVQRYIP